MPQFTKDEAQHVLWFYGEGGYPPGDFTKELLKAISRADPGNRHRLSLGFPGYVYAMKEASIGELKEVVGVDTACSHQHSTIKFDGGQQSVVCTSCWTIISRIAP